MSRHIEINGHSVEAYRDRKSASCQHYLFLRIAGREFFGAVIWPGRSRDDVLAELSRHPQLATSSVSRPQE